MQHPFQKIQFKKLEYFKILQKNGKKTKWHNRNTAKVGKVGEHLGMGRSKKVRLETDHDNNILHQILCAWSRGRKLSSMTEVGEGSARQWGKKLMEWEMRMRMSKKECVRSGKVNHTHYFWKYNILKQKKKKT